MSWSEFIGNLVRASKGAFNFDKNPDPGLPSSAIIMLVHETGL